MQGITSTQKHAEDKNNSKTGKMGQNDPKHLISNTDQSIEEIEQIALIN